MMGPLISDIEAFSASLRRGSAVNVNDQSSKDRAIGLATHYFNDVRTLVVGVNGENEVQLAHDALWQQLVRLAHGNSARVTYLKILLALRRQLREFNIFALAKPIAQIEQDQTTSREELLILRTLESIVPSAAASYRQALSDLAGGQRLSYRGTAAEFRESLRETLDHLAPDVDVMAQDWYQPEESQKLPTMRQKTRYVLTSRERNKTQRVAAEKMLGLIEELTGEVMRAVYNRASLAAHVNQSREEVAKIKRYVDTMFFDLLEIGS
jgi:hypothetical protein